MSNVVIFLDIDGVLVSYLDLKGRHPDDNEHLFKKEAVDALNMITTALDAKIIISSSWRVNRSLTYLKAIFKRRGVFGEVIGMTDRLGKRGEEIEAWLSEHDWVEKFVIIDDEMSDINPYFPGIRSHKLLTNRYRCLDEYDALYVVGKSFHDPEFGKVVIHPVIITEKQP